MQRSTPVLRLVRVDKRLQPEKVIELQFHSYKLIKIAHDNKHYMLSRFMHIIKKTANV